MTEESQSSGPVDLTTCDREPIHIPGAIQPHGALIALDASDRVRWVSANLEAYLGLRPKALLGEGLPKAILNREVRATIDQARSETRIDLVNPLRVSEHNLDAIIHCHQGNTIVELERADPIPASLHASASQAAFARMQRCRDVVTLLAECTDEMRRICQFSRVMAYRFAPDGHGEVIAESKVDALESYLGLHYPASDIPKQARRLFLENPLRTIGDVSAEPVPLLASPDAPDLDMSHAALRGVSPIHVEYLRNMGVHSSMSLSIVVEGKLWGLVVCHDTKPNFPPFALRITSIFLSRMIGLVVEQLTRQQQAQRGKQGSRAVQAATHTVIEKDDVLGGIASHGERLLDVFDAEAGFACVDTRVVSFGRELDRNELLAFVDSFKSDHRDGYCSTRIGDFFQREGLVGAIVHPFHEAKGGFVGFLRKEHKVEVRWAGNPHKPIVVGPNGPRLTPRGSFKEWREQASGQSRPFDEQDSVLLKELCSALAAITLRWATEEGKLRDAIFSIVTHDMRTPLQAIAMGAAMLEGGAHDVSDKISRSTWRMNNLLNQMVDITLLQSGRALSVNPREIDLAETVRNVIDEISLAYPGSDMSLQVAAVEVFTDEERVSQALSNLISNARHHGVPGRQIGVEVGVQDEDWAYVTVHNEGAIDESVRDVLFDAFETTGQGRRSHQGMGLGLFIVRAIADALGGDIQVRSDIDTGTTFTLCLPRREEKARRRPTMPPFQHG